MESAPKLFPLRWYDLISINLFWLAQNLRNNANLRVFIPFLITPLVAPEYINTAVGWISTAGLAIAMLSQPVFGILSDRNTSHFGRRRPFIFVGVILDLMFMTLMIFAGNIWAFLVISLMLQFSANISHGPLQGLIPDLVPEEQREAASSVKSIFELVPVILVGALIAQLVENDQAITALALVGSTLLVIMLLTMILVKEKPIEQAADQPLKPMIIRVFGMLGGLMVGALAGVLVGGLVGGIAAIIAMPFLGAQSARVIFLSIGGTTGMAAAVVAGVWVGTLFTLGSVVLRQPSFTWWVVSRFMFLAGITSIPVFAPFFIMHTFDLQIDQATGRTGILIAVVGICILIIALASIWLSKIFTKKQMLFASGLIAAVGALLLVGAIFQRSMEFVYIAGVFLGCAAGLFYPTNWAVGTLLVPRDQAGRYLGVSNLAGAGAGMIGAGIGGPLVDSLNQTSTGLGYIILLCAFSLLFLFSSFSLTGIGPLKHA
jgi:MFS family permease